MYIIIVIENTVVWHIETYQGILKCNKKLKTLAVNKLKGFFSLRVPSCFVPRQNRGGQNSVDDNEICENNYVDAMNRAKIGSSFLGKPNKPK